MKFLKENEENLSDFKVKVDFFPAAQGRGSPPAPPVQLTERCTELAAVTKTQ